MDYDFDLNSQESIAFANVIMENDDSNMAGIKKLNINSNCKKKNQILNNSIFSFLSLF